MTTTTTTTENTTISPPPRKGGYYMRPRFGYIVHEFETAQRRVLVGEPKIYQGWTNFKKDHGELFPTQQSLYDHMRRRLVMRKTIKPGLRDHIYVERIKFRTPVWIQRSVKKKKTKETKNVETNETKQS